MPRRIGVLSLHTSPLDQPGVGDAGGMNVYIEQTSLEMTRRGIGVEIFTRATSPEQPTLAELAPGVRVHHVRSGPLRPLSRQEFFARLTEFESSLRRLIDREMASPNGKLDVVHSHYWLSGLVGDRISRESDIPWVHTAHTLARVKSAGLVESAKSEVDNRTSGEEEIAENATLLLANTALEAQQWNTLYQAESDRIRIVEPGVDLGRFFPGSTEDARAELGISSSAKVIAFVGRLQPHKGPDLLLESVARMVAKDSRLRRELVVLIVGGSSGEASDQLAVLQRSARSLGIERLTYFLPPRSGTALRTIYLAADLVAVPSSTESFGLVALEAQACGTPVIAADVGGLRTSVADGFSGVLVPSRDPRRWADTLATVMRDPIRMASYSRQAMRHARHFSWRRTTDALVSAYGEVMNSTRCGFESGVAV